MNQSFTVYFEAAALSLVYINVCAEGGKKERSLTNGTPSYMGNYGRLAL